MIREPAFAGPGQFYPSSPGQLRAMISGFVEANAPKTEAIGVMVPHAGYQYSGQVAAAVISRVILGDTVVLMGPNHHTGVGKPLSIMAEGIWKSPLGKANIDADLARLIMAEADKLEDDYIAHQYEHSLEVQVPFLQYFKPDIEIVPILFSQGNIATLKEIGRGIASAIKKSAKKVTILASSDMNHYESDETAREKDGKALEAILRLDEDGLVKRIAELDISMCGYMPAVALIVAAKELGAKGAELVRYQTSGDVTGDYASVVGYAGVIFDSFKVPTLVRLAKETVETYVKTRKIIKPPAKLAPEMKEQAGVFVSLHKLGQLRGCIGTFEPTQATVAEEVIRNAISSATGDPRFSPVKARELGYLTYSVDVLTKPEPVNDKEALDAKKYGVIVECGYRRGLLLPDLEGVDTPDAQIDICCQKGGISPGEPLKLYRFEVKREQ